MMRTSRARSSRVTQASVPQASKSRRVFDLRLLLKALNALKRGDFTVRLPDDLADVAGKVADTFNDVVELNERLSNELERIRVNVGKQGNIKQRASIGDVTGSWQRSEAALNGLVEDLVYPTSEVSRVIGAVAKGDLGQTMGMEIDGRPLEGEFLRTARTVNTMVDQLRSFASEVTRVAREVGTEGKLGGQADVQGVSGTWKDLTENVNLMASNLTAQVRNIAEVTTAVANGDLTKKITVDVRGEFLSLKETVNTMVDQLRSFASEVTRVAREVGTEGVLGGQARVEGVAGTWKDLTDSVNSMAGNLTAQVRNIADVTKAVAAGNLSRQITVDVKGEMLELKNTINTMVDQLNSFASEVSRVAREVGTEGRLGGQADVKGVSGTWRDLTENVNAMASNLTVQLRDVSKVATAIASGDLSQKITVEVKGEILLIKETINQMVDQLNSFAGEVTRVAREVGTEGKLGGQADVKGVAGTWKDLTDSVNSMASNLTAQVRNIADVTKAVAAGDLSRKITVPVKGEIEELKLTINTMVDQLSSFASEVTRVAREVGGDGKLGGQARVEGVSGTWKDLTDSVNFMAGNLTAQVRNIADVTTAVAKGDLSRKITVDVKGEILELKNTINTMVDQLNSFAAEVTRVAREVGSEGKLGGQADVRGVSGTWKDLTDSVNFMAGNLTTQVRNIAEVTTAVAKGDLSKKITVDVRGELLDLKNTINTMVDQLNGFAGEVTRVAREVGGEGILGGQAKVEGVSGTWRDLTESVNFMAGNLTKQVRNIALVTTAVANGDLSRKITVDVKGELLDLKNTINTMVDQLNSFAGEVTRVAREVGTEGILGGQAVVPGVGGTWKDLTDNVNFMARNLTNQVRGIAWVVTAVANGDLKQKLLVEARGEIAELAGTINSMIDTLATFADQVTTVAREVGTEGKLGGQAEVPGAAGTWRALTDNVNRLAANLTGQVRAIAEVATAVTKGDLTRSIQIEAAGEVGGLKDTINEMIRNLKDTTLRNAEQDWLKTNLAKFTRMLQGQKELITVGKLILSELASTISAQHGAFYTVDTSGQTPILKLLASYAYNERRSLANRFAFGEGVVGQAALEKERILLTNVPGDYIKISSGLGKAPPLNIIVLPVLFEGQVKAMIELASFERFSPAHQSFLDQLMESIGIVINTIEANSLTEDLLKQSQNLAGELQTRQQELQNTNAELELKAQQLAAQNVEVEHKNREVEQARLALEEKARQLALTSKYKSEFLANMSHELRTPLNSLLILADQLGRNTDGNLKPRQIEFAKTIYDSGQDLLRLINDILDLSKIESGTISLDIGTVPLEELTESVQRTFHHVASEKGLDFEIHVSPGMPKAVYTDAQRIEQLLKNLISNAIKFTDQGSVTLDIAPVTGGWTPGHTALDRADTVIALAITDTGIGIPPDKQQLIFEAFQQADGTTNRKYGGTGLGLAISREIARLLRGEIRLVSLPGKGSTFTFYLPQSGPERAAVPVPRTRSDHKPVVTIPPSRLKTPETELITDDSQNIQPEDAVVLLIEDDTTFVRTEMDLVHELGMKVLVATHGEHALQIARKVQPTGIVLDITLPDMDGWQVLNELKEDLNTRHIPVFIISVHDRPVNALRTGALDFISKPVTREQILEILGRIQTFHDRPRPWLLVVEDDESQRRLICETIGLESAIVTAVGTAAEAREALSAHLYQVVVLNLRLPDASGFDLMDEMRAEYPHLATIVYTDKELTPEEESLLARKTHEVILKDVRSLERLLDEVMLRLHIEVDRLPDEQREIITRLHHADDVLAGKTVLIVDDDVRNLFALTSVMETHGMEVVTAESGPEALASLEHHPAVDAVLMDIMLPGMDGYEAIRQIRSRSEFSKLPILAVTAKVMPGDMERCINAGASDYVAKPVDPEKLLAQLRKWILR